MMFSLIVATYGREEELKTLFKSLVTQEYGDFEVIVVDQNKDCRLDDIIKQYSQVLDIVHHKSDQLGLSYNRNIGLKIAKGSYVAFPDDDCSYPPSLLKKVSYKFQNNDINFLTFRCEDEDSNRPLLRTFPKSNKKLSVGNVMRMGMSISIFTERAILNESTYFNESIGSGCEYGSGEESDFLMKLIECGHKGYYYSDIIVNHPYPSLSVTKETLSRTKKYALGHGKVIRDHLCIGMIPQFFWSLMVRPILGLAMSIKSFSSIKNNLILMKYRWIGFIKNKID